MPINQFSGPIPGENFTSDTKNYPWHRPPEYTDLDKAIDAIAKKLLSEDAAMGILTMVEMGMTVATITDTFLTSGIGAGKWTPDFALLLAGPTSHIICMMCEAEDIEYDLGIDRVAKAPTSKFFKEVNKENNVKKNLKKLIPIDGIKQIAAKQDQLEVIDEMEKLKRPKGFMDGPPMASEPQVPTDEGI